MLALWVDEMRLLVNGWVPPEGEAVLEAQHRGAQEVGTVIHDVDSQRANQCLDAPFAQDDI